MLKRCLYPIEYAAILGGMGLVGMILFPLFARARPSDGTHFSCPSNLKQIALAISMYATDYNGFAPSVQDKGAMFGWADALISYTKSKYLFQCPTERNGGPQDPTQSGFTDYWFNAQISGRSLAGIKTPAQTLLSGDGNDGTDLTDARYSLSALPPGWKNDPKSPLFRHFGSANYVFADGHAKAFLPTSINNPLIPTGPQFKP